MQQRIVSVIYYFESMHLFVDNPDNGRELTDDKLTKLSQFITSNQELRVLAINGLGMEDYVIETELHNNKDLFSAASKVLNRWRKGITNAEIAYSKLKIALESVNMAFYVSAVLEKD